MAGDYLRVNTAALTSDVNDLRELMAQIKNNLDRAYISVATLDGMWDGPANDTFNTQFSNDHQEFLSLCNGIDGLFLDMLDAAKKYDGCENEIYSTISSLNI